MVEQLPLHVLAPGIGTDGQVATLVDRGDGILEYQPADPTGGSGGASLDIFNVKDPAYGALGDGTTDDTAAINLAIAALNTAGVGVLYFPPGTYKTTGNLTVVTAICSVVGSGCADVYDNYAVSTITTSANNTPLLTINRAGCGVTGLHFRSVAGSTPVSGSAGLLVTGGDAGRYYDCSFSGFYIDMDVQDGTEWYMRGCYFYNPVKYGLKIRHIDLPDGGDQSIVGCQFLTRDYAADAHIRYESAGGLKLQGCKFNARDTSIRAQTGLDATLTGVTGVLTVCGNSFENITGSAILGRESGGSFQSVAIGVNQFGYYVAGSMSAIDIDGWNDVTITGNSITNYGGSSGTAIKLANVTGGAVGLNGHRGFASQYTLTSCTGIEEVGAGTTLTVKDEGSNIDTAVSSISFVGDVVAATTDGSGHVTVTTSVPSSVGELLMQDGVTGPPVPIETEAGDDWLYEG